MEHIKHFNMTSKEEIKHVWLIGLIDMLKIIKLI